MSDCQNCLALQAEIIRLQAENVRLTQEIIRLSHIIATAKSACVRIASSADEVMSTHQPRAKWAYAQAAKTSALTILDLLG